MSQLKRSDAFALLIPLSPTARRALKCAHRNRILLDKATNYTNQTKLVTSEQEVLAKLDFMSILGRGSLTFGYSRTSSFQILQDEGVSPLHFRLQLDINTATLVLTDTSGTGTLVTSRKGSTLLHRSDFAFEMDDSICISVGKDMKFCIVLGDGMRDSGRRAAVFKEHVRSVRLACSTILRRMPLSFASRVGGQCHGRAVGHPAIDTPRRSSQAVLCA
jgi:hypothetical protein